MRQFATGRFWRRIAAAVAAYAIALQAALSGLGLATLAAAANAAALPICSEHAADPAGGPSRPANDPWLCPCAAGCTTAGGSVLADAPQIAALTLGAALPAALSRCSGLVIPSRALRGPQIPRAPPTI